jgi:hypothetical protein
VWTYRYLRIMYISMCRTTYAVAERDVDWSRFDVQTELLIERELLEQEYYNYVDLQWKVVTLGT